MVISNRASRSRQMIRHAIVAAALICLTAGRIAADGRDDSDALVFEAPCQGPASTPACASKTWEACMLFRDPSRCELVGFHGMKFWDWEQFPAKKSELPRLEIPLLSVRGPIDGVRRVEPERFREGLEEPGAFKVPGNMIGTHEVTFRLNICGDRPCTARGSNFFRKHGDRWVITSWADDTLSCEGWTEATEPDCSIYIPFLRPWQR